MRSYLHIYVSQLMRSWHVCSTKSPSTTVRLMSDLSQTLYKTSIRIEGEHLLLVVIKVRRHYSISYIFNSNDRSILKLYRFKEYSIFNIRVSTILQLFQSYFTIIKSEVYIQGIEWACHLLLILHIIVY